MIRCVHPHVHIDYIWLYRYIKKHGTDLTSDTPSLGPDLPRRHSADASGELQDLPNMSLGVFSVRSAIDTISIHQFAARKANAESSWAETTETGNVPNPRCRNTGFDKGHLAPSLAMSFQKDKLKRMDRSPWIASYFASNIAPQPLCCKKFQQKLESYGFDEKNQNPKVWWDEPKMRLGLAEQL